MIAGQSMSSTSLRRAQGYFFTETASSGERDRSFTMLQVSEKECRILIEEERVAGQVVVKEMGSWVGKPGSRKRGVMCHREQISRLLHREMTLAPLGTDRPSSSGRGADYSMGANK